MADEATFTDIRKDILAAFTARWSVLRPSWNHGTQTSFPPASFREPQSAWIKLICTNQGGRNRAVAILDEVTCLFTVDCYAPFDGDDLTTMFAVDPIADDAHNALRSMTLPVAVAPLDVIPQDLPITDTGFEHKRLGFTFRFDLEAPG